MSLARRGEKEGDETDGQRTTRERRARLEAIQRVLEDPDFSVFLAFIDDQVERRTLMCQQPLLTPQDLARHNSLIGEIAGLRLVRRAADVLLELEKVASDT